MVWEPQPGLFGTSCGQLCSILPLRSPMRVTVPSPPATQTEPPAAVIPATPSTGIRREPAPVGRENTSTECWSSRRATQTRPGVAAMPME